MIYMLLADGFEEVEALTPLDLLRRAGADILTVGIQGATATGSHGITFACDIDASEMDLAAADMLILPGGMPGTTNLDACRYVDEAIGAVTKKGGRLAAICAAPLILGRRGLLEGKHAVCYPGFEKELRGAIVSEHAGVVTDGNITTAKGMGVAFDFGIELVRILFGAEKAASVAQSTMHHFSAVAEKSSTIAEAPDYVLPSSDLLAESILEADENELAEIENRKNGIIDTLASFNVRTSIQNVERGPRVTRYEVVPDKGVRAASVVNLFPDVCMGLSALGVRMESNPEKGAICFEVPNKRPKNVYLRDLIESDKFQALSSKTAACIGKDVAGTPVISDIAKMPHLLLAGATGMGKTVCIHSLIMSVLFKARPDEVKLILIDPKKVELQAYEGIPHLLMPIVTEALQAAAALTWAIEEMERRYERFKKADARNIEAYNKKASDPMPKILIVIDELSDLMLQVREPAENLIMSIAQKARATGIHLIIGTQRPSVNVITGIIKANIPSRIACKVTASVDSRTILEQTGAEKLLNNGDMLYHPVGIAAPMRVQGAFVTDQEVEAVVKFIKKQAVATYDKAIAEEIDRIAKRISSHAPDAEDEEEETDGIGRFLADKKFLAAVEIAITNRKIATSLIQRKLSIGYGKAAMFIDVMESLGIISPPNGAKPREVLISMDDWQKMLKRLENN